MNNPKFIAGDIVEVLNLSQSQIHYIKCSNASWEDYSQEIIGQKYYVDKVYINKHEVSFILKDFNSRDGIERWFRQSQLRLYKRPIINWIKYFWKK